MKIMKNYFFIKSEYTKQVMIVTEMPKFGGWVLSNIDEFVTYYSSLGIDPKSMLPKTMLLK